MTAWPDSPPVPAVRPILAAPRRAPRTARSVVVIPALQPGGELVHLVGELLDAGIDAIVVDDGSGPAYRVTFDRCELAGAEVIRLAENHGKGYALRAGFAALVERFPGSGAVTADADGQHTLADIRAVRDLVDGAAVRGAAAPIVLGVRSFARGDVPWKSRLGNAISALTFRMASGVSIGDTQTGLRGIPAPHLVWAGALPGDRYEYEYTMLVRAAREGKALVTVPIRTVYVDQNAGSHFRPLRDSVRVLGPVLAFAGSGLATFVLDTAMFLAIAGLGAQLWVALALARLTSSGVNFSLNRWVVFRGGRKPPLGRSLLQYAVLAAVVLAGGMVLVDALVAIGVPLLGAKIGADLGLFALSYAAQRMVVFRRR